MQEQHTHTCTHTHTHTHTHTAFSKRVESSSVPSCFSGMWCISVLDIKRDVSFRSTSERRTQTQQNPRPVCLPPASPGTEKWERFCSDGGAKMIVFSDVLWPRRSPRWRWQRHSGIGCGCAWQASKASVLFLPGRAGTASQPATLQQPN